LDVSYINILKVKNMLTEALFLQTGFIKFKS
jgi:hypothetical protein